MAKKICKDCAGRGWIAGPLYALEGSYKCPTCDGAGTIHRTGPYRLTDGTWSDGIDRTHRLRDIKFNRVNPGRWTVNNGCYGWEAFRDDSDWVENPDPFHTHAEAIRYADHHARTTKNGDNND